MTAAHLNIGGRWETISRRPGSARLALPLAAIFALGEWNGLVRALAGGPVLGFVLDVALLAIAVKTILGRPGVGTEAQLNGIDLLVGAYFGLALVEILNPNVPSVLVGVEGFRKSAMMAVAYFVVRASGARDAQAFMKAAAVLSVPAMIMGVRQFLWPLPIDFAIIDSSSAAVWTFHQAGTLRAFSPTSGPFLFGLVASLAFMTATAAFMAGRVRWIVVAVLALAALALSITRANIVATAIGAIAVIVAYQWSCGRKTLALTLAAGSLFAVSVATLLGSLFGGVGFERMVAELTAGTDPFNDPSFETRIGLWGDFMNAIGANPLIGYGTSSAADGLGAQYAMAGHDFFSPHSIYFKAILEMGLLGLVLLVWFLLALGIATMRCREPFLRAVSLGVFLLVIVSGISGPMLDAYPFNLAFWTLAGYLINSRQALSAYSAGKVATTREIRTPTATSGSAASPSASAR